MSIEFKVSIVEQIKINAESIHSFFSFPGYFLCLLFIVAVMLKNKFNFMKMLQDQMSVDKKIIIIIKTSSKISKMVTSDKHLFGTCT